MIFDPLPALPNNEVLLLKHLIVALGSSGPPAFVGPLDNFTTALAVATSVEERLLSSYPASSPLIRVRRSSDNAELNIGSTSSGALDTAALLAFAGVGSAFVVTLYDQSGNGKDATQATAAAQPRVVNAGVLDSDGMVFLGGAQNLQIASAPFTDYATTTSLNIISRQKYMSGDCRLFTFNSNELNAWVLFSGTLYWDAPLTLGRISYAPASFAGNEKLLSLERDNLTSRIRVDGSVDHSGAVAGIISGTSIFIIGNGVELTNGYNGNIKNFCVWKTASSADCAARSAAL